MNLRIVSPEKLVFEGEGFTSITLPTESGEITVLPGHLPIISKLEMGEIIAKKGEQEESIVTTKGFLKVDEIGNILLLCDYAVRSEEIEIAKVEEAKNKAEASMKEKLNEKDFALAQAELARTLLELKIAHRRKAKIRTS